MNSREKGKRGERLWRDELRACGYSAKRGQQFSGSPDSPDVVCAELDWIHFEVKAVERLNIEDAMEQARKDCGARSAGSGMRVATPHPGPLPDRGGEGDASRGFSPQRKTPVVAHKRSHRRWLVTMEAEFFFRLLRGDVPNLDSFAPARSALCGLSPSANSLGRFPSDPNLRGVLPPEDKPTEQTKQTEQQNNEDQKQ